MLAVHAMGRPFRRELALIVAWLVFPLVPVVLEDVYYQISVLNPQANARFGPDPHEWDWSSWVLMLGPLLGYGFLAGATVDLPDDLGAQGRWLAPAGGATLRLGGDWAMVGHSGIGCGLFRLTYFSSFFPSAQSPVQVPVQPTPSSGGWLEPVSAWVSVAVLWILAAILTLMWSYSWLWPAWAALGGRRGSAVFSRAFYRGLSVALAFVGSLFGSFWAATSLWRSYFFDRTRGAPGPRGDRTLADQRLCQPDHIRRGAAPRAVSRDAGGLGPRAWP